MMAKRLRPQPITPVIDGMELAAGSAPLYLQVRERLRRQILEGTYQPGDRIPSEEEIASSSGVNRLTARRAVSDLVREGVLQRRSKIGTFVLRRRLICDPGSLASYWERMTALGLRPTSQVLDKRQVLALPEISDCLEVDKAEPVYRLCRLRFANDEPICYQVAYIPALLFPGLLEEDLEVTFLYAIYRQRGYVPAAGEQWIEARSADETIAARLDLSAGAPILFLSRITRSTKQRPIELVFASYRSDRYTVYMPLR